MLTGVAFVEMADVRTWLDWNSEVAQCGAAEATHARKELASIGKHDSTELPLSGALQLKGCHQLGVTVFNTAWAMRGHRPCLWALRASTLMPCA